MADLSWKRVGTDITGYACLVGVVLFGWLPGPGGIPLLITGLGLLSIYNPWAKGLLKFVLKHSNSLRGLMFPNNKWIKMLWDIITLLLLSTAIYLMTSSHSVIWRGISISLYCLSIAVFLFNRNRLHWLQKKK